MKYEGLTRVQVEAFKECFDLIRNGYREIMACSDTFFWFIKLRHEKKKSRIEFHIQDFSYQISRNGKCIKSVSRMPSPERYHLEVNSEDDEAHIITYQVDCKKLISDSDLPNVNER